MQRSLHQTLSELTTTMADGVQAATDSIQEDVA
jgi:hypothetical protein